MNLRQPEHQKIRLLDPHPKTSQASQVVDDLPPGDFPRRWSCFTTTHRIHGTNGIFTYMHSWCFMANVGNSTSLMDPNYGPWTWSNSGNDGRLVFGAGEYYKTLILNYQTWGDITWRQSFNRLHHGTSKLCWSATRMLGPVPWLHWSFRSHSGIPSFGQNPINRDDEYPMAYKVWTISIG